MAGLCAPCSSSDSKPVHKGAGASRMNTDDKSVCSVLDVLSSWKYPFLDDGGDTLVNISSGMTAPIEVVHHLSHVCGHGEQCLKQFVEDRLINCTTSFYEPLTKLKLKTFQSILKTSHMKVKGKDVVVRADRIFFLPDC